MKQLPACLAPAFLIALAAVPTSAQALLGMSADGTMTGFVGPASGPCNYPPGPLTQQWPWNSNFLCPAPKAIPGSAVLLGDLAIDQRNDLIWTTDGSAIAELQAFGTVLRSFQIGVGEFLQGKLTGLGLDAPQDLLWITDGVQAAAIQPPAAPGCPQSASLVLGPFDLPLPTGVLATDIEYDKSSGTLWICDDQGFVSEVTLAGTLGNAGRFSALAHASCGLSAPLTSLAIDPSVAPGTVFVTDGTRVFHLVAPSGLPAAPSFAFGEACWTPPNAGLVGLGFQAYSTIYGKPSVGFLPVIGTSGQSVQGNSDFAIELAGAKQNDLAALFAGPFPFCPALPIAGGQALTLIDLSTLLVISVADVNGLVHFPAPLSPVFPVGSTAYLQWYTVNPTTFVTKTTAGLELTICRQ